VNFDQLPPAAVLKAWPAILPFLEQIEAEFPDDWPVHYLAQRIINGLMQIWAVWDETGVVAVIGAEIGTKATGKRVLDVRIASGRDRHLWVPMVRDRLEAEARKLNCALITFDGRAGWSRDDLPDYAKRRFITARKELT